VRGCDFQYDGAQIDMGNSLKKAVIVGNIFTVSPFIHSPNWDGTSNVYTMRSGSTLSFELEAFFITRRLKSYCTAVCDNCCFLQGSTRLSGKASNTQTGLNADDSPSLV